MPSEPAKVEIEYQPVVWSRLVKERDFGKCVVCGREDELVACMVLSESQGGKRTLENGVTLCVECSTSGKAVLFSPSTTRLNLEVDRSLYLSFREKCRDDGVSISAAVRALIVEYLERSE